MPFRRRLNAQPNIDHSAVGARRRVTRSMALVLSLILTVGVLPEILDPTGVAAAPDSPTSLAQVADSPAAAPPASKVTAKANDDKKAAPDPGKAFQADRFSEFEQQVRNPSGSLTQTVYPGPVFEQDDAGKWRGIDLALETKAGGRISAKTHKKAATIGARSGGNVVELDTPAGKLAVRHPNAADKAAKIEDRSARFDDALPGGRHLVEDLLVDGFEETVIVPTRAGGSSYTLAAAVRRDLISQSDADRFGWTATGLGSLRNLFRGRGVSLWRNLIERTGASQP